MYYIAADYFIILLFIVYIYYKRIFLNSVFQYLAYQYVNSKHGYCLYNRYYIVQKRDTKRPKNQSQSLSSLQLASLLLSLHLG